jgi:hypothetical protein
MEKPDLGWYRAQLARFTYKPLWSFTIVPGAAWAGAPWWEPIPEIRVEMLTEDTYNPGRVIRVLGSRPLYDIGGCDETAFAMTLASLIAEMEVHEAREWLRRDGEIYDDPHKSTPLAPPTQRF